MRLDQLFSFRVLSIICIVAAYALFFTEKTNLMASDLGRHIMNGRLILSEHTVFSTNRYSYTEQERYVPNHHWLFGVFVALGERVGGFALLSVLTSTLYTAGVGAVLLRSMRSSPLWIAVGSAALLLPIITSRAEVRPEAISVCCAVCVYLLMDSWIERRLTTVLTAAMLFLLMVVWTNTHIFFILIVPLLGAFGVQLFFTKHVSRWRPFLVLLSTALLATICNPLGHKGALYPFMIFTEYGYAVAENQTLFFLLARFPSPTYWYTAVGIGVILILMTYVVVQHRALARQHTALLLITFFFAIATLKLIRFQNFFGVFSLPLCIFLLSVLYTSHRHKIVQFFEHPVAVMSGSLVGLGLLTVLLGSGIFTQRLTRIGLGLFPGSQDAGVFIKSLSIQGPLFNNFDSGSYLTYFLYPQRQVFVDNRAEAYSSSFLKRYKDAQENDAVWKELDTQYRFGMIAFYRLENTEWGQKFLITRLSDPQWVPVYVDPFALVFVRNIPQHQDIISQYRLPKEVFTITR